MDTSYFYPHSYLGNPYTPKDVPIPQHKYCKICIVVVLCINIFLYYQFLKLIT